MANRLPSKNLEGKRVRLSKTTDAYTRLQPGVTGTVSMVNDTGTVHVQWDNGSTLGLIWAEGDRWMVIPVATVPAHA